MQFKNKTIYKLLKFNASKLEIQYMGETIYKFKCLNYLDFFNIEQTIERITKDIKQFHKNYIKHSTNHQVKTRDNGVVDLILDIDRDSHLISRSHTITFLDFSFRNNLQVMA